MSAAGAFIRLTNFILRLLQLCTAVIILGIFSYFLAVLTDHQLDIPTWMKAVEGIGGAATFYTLVASIFTLCIGGVAFFAALMLFFDVCCIGAFIAVAILTRNGTEACTGEVDTPLGRGDASKPGTGWGEGGFGAGGDKNLTYMPNLGFACRLQKVVFAVSIIGCVLFALSLYPQVLYARHHRRGKKFGPSPGNNYTEGPSRSGPRSWRRFGRRRPASTADPAAGAAVGSYPLTTKGETAPDQYKGGMFTRMKKSKPADGKVDPQVDDLEYGGYRNSSYSYGGSTAGGDSGVGSGGASAGYANYGYGQSGVGDAGYSHGYGAGPQYETAQFPVSSGQRNY
ncbi:hypothetical protein AJ79_00473 [Helicocarpus griseus UAMH5409]|uniref:MARVEL domain-containing protein n=1 Tax=Helicocarpus griseus UAMH5409 TaxID=1447875 RepID=A0A2B7Y2U0_9EURO|nr:hypothetical protein AJ79_00473 [Helicocarpus griseus UAMH5409]